LKKQLKPSVMIGQLAGPPQASIYQSLMSLKMLQTSCNILYFKYEVFMGMSSESEIACYHDLRSGHESCPV